MLGEFGKDMRFAVRQLLREPVFAALAILTLAVGTGATTAAFGVVHAVLLAPLDYPAADRLVTVREQTAGGAVNNVSWPNFEDWRERSRTVLLSAHTPAYEAMVLGGGEATRPAIALVDAAFFRVMAVKPRLGRVFSHDEQLPGGPAAAVVSEGFWRRQLGGERDLSRLVVEVLGAPAQVVGIMPAGFSYPRGAEVWVPLEQIPPSQRGTRTAHNFQVTGRLAAGAGLEAARSELSAVMREIHEQEGVSGVAVAVRPLHEHTVADARRGLLILLAASGLVLLVACTNMASALLGRAARRTRELAVRASLGASRGRLVRQLLTESLVLGVLGAAGGLLLAVLFVGAVLQVAPDAVPRLDEVRLNGTVLAFTSLIAILTAVAFGTAPALHATRQGGRLVAGRDTGGRRLGRAWTGLVTAEVALALVLLVGAGLLIRSLWNVLQVDTGFSAERVVTATISLPEARYDGDARVRFHDRMLQELEALPGVQAVALTRALPLVGVPTHGMFNIEGGEPGYAHYRVVSPSWFETMGIPLLRGRIFTMVDREGAPAVAVINRRLAEEFFPGEDPIGRRIETGGMDAQGAGVYATIVGVVGDVRTSYDEPAPAAYYLPYAQRWTRVQTAAFVVRTTVRSGALPAAVRDRIRAVDPEVAVEVRTFREQMAGHLAGRRFMVLVLGSFAGAAVVLAAMGIYGIVSAAVARRTREIGIRTALGARRNSILWLVSRGTMTGVLAGLLLGALGAAAISRLMAALLYDVAAVDPLTFAGVAGVLLAVAGAAVLLPARRATRVMPVEALRAE